MSFDPFTIAAGLGLGALSMLLRGKAPGAETIGWDQQPTPLASRGAALPVVIGRCEVAPVMLWAGDRVSRRVKGGKSLGGGKGGDQRIYQEAAWWGLCAAPIDGIDTLHAVRVDGGKPIYEGPLDRIAGSGTHFVLTAPHKGNGHMYFGEFDQALNPRLAQGTGAGTLGVGVDSRWPRLAYIDPRRMELGSSPVWGSLRVEVECRYEYDLGAGPAWINTLDGGGAHNPAHALYALLTEPYPIGAGIPCARVHCDFFEELALRCATEGIGVNYAAGNAQTVAQAIAAILSDAGALLLERDGMLSVELIRDPDEDELDGLPIVTDAVYGKEGVRCVEQDPPAPVNRSLFFFKDREHDYRDVPVHRQSAASAEVAGQVRPARIDLPTITNADVAVRVADRKSLELATSQRQFSFRALRGASRLNPGRPFRLDVPGEGTLLCSTIAVEREPLTDAADIVAAPLVFGRRAFFFTPPPTPPAPPPPAVVEDLVFVPQELPFAFVRALGDVDAPRLGVARVRGSEVVVGATILASDSGMSYVALGQEESTCFGGELTALLPPTRTIVDRDGLLASGPVILEYNADIEDAEDLSDPALESQWLAGRQVVIIGEGEDAEICFVRGLTALGAGEHQLFGLVRARHDTRQRTAGGGWPAGTPVLFVRVASESRVRSFTAAPTVNEGATAHVKSVPFGLAGEVDAGDVAAETIPLVARAARPLPPLNVRAHSSVSAGRPGADEYAGGDDVRITWDYRVRDGGGSGAGETGAGAALAMKPHREGPFEVEIWSSATLRRTLTLDSDDTGLPDGSSGGVIYTDAMNSADHGGTPAAAFEARVWATRMGRRSRVADVVTLTKV
jgi:hypothetical protein